MAFTYNPNMNADYSAQANGNGGENKFSQFRNMQQITRTTAAKNAEIMSCIYKSGTGAKGEWQMMKIELADWANNQKLVSTIFVSDPNGAALFNDLLGLTGVKNCEIEEVTTPSGYTFQKIPALEGKTVDAVVEVYGVKNGYTQTRTAGFFKNGFSMREINAKAQTAQDAALVWQSCRCRKDFAAELNAQASAPVAPRTPAVPSFPAWTPQHAAPQQPKQAWTGADPLPHIPHGPVTVQQTAPQNSDDIPF